MERRSFFARALSFLGVASASTALKCTEVDAATNTITLEDGPSLYLVDVTRVDMRGLTAVIDAPALPFREGDVLITYIPAPDSDHPAIMRVPDIEMEGLKAMIRKGEISIPDILRV